MKRAYLRPQALADQQETVRNYRRVAGPRIAADMVAAARKALDQIEQDPGRDSPRLDRELGTSGLRGGCVPRSSLIWFYFEREDCLDVVRLLDAQEDILSILNLPDAETRTALVEAGAAIAGAEQVIRAFRAQLKKI